MYDRLKCTPRKHRYAVRNRRDEPILVLAAKPHVMDALKSDELIFHNKRIRWLDYYEEIYWFILNE